MQIEIIIDLLYPILIWLNYINLCILNDLPAYQNLQNNSLGMLLVFQSGLICFSILHFNITKYIMLCCAIYFEYLLNLYFISNPRISFIMAILIYIISAKVNSNLQFFAVCLFMQSIRINKYLLNAPPI